MIRRHSSSSLLQCVHLRDYRAFSAGWESVIYVALNIFVFNQTFQVLAYGNSEYVRKFGLTVDPTLVTTQARVLKAPVLKYGAETKLVRPNDVRVF